MATAHELAVMVEKLDGKVGTLNTATAAAEKRVDSVLVLVEKLDVKVNGLNMAAVGTEKRVDSIIERAGEARDTAKELKDELRALTDRVVSLEKTVERLSTRLQTAWVAFTIVLAPILVFVAGRWVYDTFVVKSPSPLPSSHPAKTTTP
jgi:chromosome segregation ATPase